MYVYMYLLIAVLRYININSIFVRICNDLSKQILFKHAIDCKYMYMYLILCKYVLTNDITYIFNAAIYNQT